MSDPEVLARVFLAALPGHVAEASAPAGLGEAIASLHARGRAAWPDIDVPAAAFAAHLGGCTEPTAVAPAAIVTLVGEDLYLACACARGEPVAQAAFARRYAEVIRAAVRRIDGARGQRDDASQLVLDRLLVAAPGDTPRIASYSGRAELAAFVRVVATRQALTLVRGDVARDQIGDEALASLDDGADDPELRYLKQHYQAQFKAAFEIALGRLSPADRALLRYQIVDGLGLDQIAAIVGKPRSTMGRHVLAARANLIDETRAELRRQLRIDAGELASVLRLVQSSLDVSVRRLLGEDALP
jgi:RNA polymerase sigma-70 factor (ECF subfamily)